MLNSESGNRGFLIKKIAFDTALKSFDQIEHILRQQCLHTPDVKNAADEINNLRSHCLMVIARDFGVGDDSPPPGI